MSGYCFTIGLLDNLSNALVDDWLFINSELKIFLKQFCRSSQLFYS